MKATTPLGCNNTVTSKSMTIVAAAVIIIIIVGGLLYLTHSNKECRNIEIAEACFLTNKVIIEIQGDCDKPVTLKFFDDKGNLKSSVNVPVGEKVIVPLNPNLAPGDYKVSLYVEDNEVGTLEAKVYLAPYLVNARAVAWPNGTIFIDYTSKTPPCLKNYGITTVIVRVNGTVFNETGFWKPTDKIRLDLNISITPSTNVIITIIDSLGQVYNNVPLARPI